MRASRAMPYRWRSARIWAATGSGVGLVLAVLAVAKVVDALVPGAHVAVGLGLAVRSGLRWGLAAAVLVGAAYAVASLAAPVREALPDGQGGLGRGLLTAVLVVIPLGTVLPEELAFRGVLLPLLGRRHGLPAAALLSSALFGLWHVLASLGGGTANAAIAGVVGEDAAGTVLRVVVTVLFTSLAGVVLCALRARSGSLVAPVLAHWTVNGLGVIVASLA
jgi:uncharacterized protein